MHIVRQEMTTLAKYTYFGFKPPSKFYSVLDNHINVFFSQLFTKQWKCNFFVEFSPKVDLCKFQCPHGKT